jgi:hypothetical protein
MSWKKSTSMYLSNIQASYIESLKFGIETSKKQIDDNISLMKVSMERTKTEMAEERKKYQLIRQEFNNLMAGYTKILQVNVADDTERPEIRVANPVEKQEGPNLYSHLEE